MPRRKAVAHFVAVSDLSQPATQQEGILIEVTGRGGDTPINRARALEILQQMWEKGEIEAEKFPDGMTQDHIVYVPPESPQPLKTIKTKQGEETNGLPPILQGAREIIQLTQLQLEVQEVAEEAEPYLPIVQAVLERTRPLNAEEKELAKDKNYGKTLEKLGTVIAKQEAYREQCTGHAKLILNALTWQLNQGVKSPSPTPQKQKTSKRRSTARES